ncbi:hypothetical protein N866_07065 [Actinotalea ferrariae CF5-4]|uniref:Uncharacterized protein n=1 Tax=Actinotalea ferrariae CF5-4 TaxID=948458 RepID=A0A021VU60_9CELL|nr:hypothetical protein [Actinotalea ferrariae]EYR64663.1 hypothetical protein N866_07065 [Actinotalea ferrariae CF5-4]
MTAPRCASSCPLVERLVIDHGRATGRDERLVRLAYGIGVDDARLADLIRALLAEMPTTADPRGWLTARLHDLDQETT